MRSVRSRLAFAPGSYPVRLLSAAIIVLVVATVACGTSDGERVVAAESGAIDINVPRPGFTLTDTDGKPFGFASQTAGRLTFLEFGYTNCPDVCPVHMANLASVLGKLSPTERMRTTVVFVTVDPDRDTGPVLRKWLDGFDTKFIGLRGSTAEVDAIQKEVGLGAATVAKAADGSVTVTHASPVIVFTADDTAHVMYPFGTRQSDWIRDLPRLLDHGAASSAKRATEPTRAPPPLPKRPVERVFVVMPAGQGPAALYFVANNLGETADTIVAVATDAIGPASLHESMQDQAGTAHMMPVPAIAVPPHGSVRLAPGGFHGMIGPLRRGLIRGESVVLVVRFKHAGNVQAIGTVITYADVDTTVAPRN